ncbi:hypothetical protein FQR65_LT05505 [Abscondita terminalis]|nr:hypothetical protein FQR65_LT05505 [Abscondita terminalis]
MYFTVRSLFINTNFAFAKELRRNFARRRPVANPGIHHRKELVEDAAIDLEDYDLDLESDFANVGASYAEHIKEIRHEKDREQHLIVKQKYFKEKSPNFLSWADKEQIRYLHKSDPEEWTIEKLAEGFPALPHVISKILKASWTKKSVQKIQSHDKSVEENWKLFREKKIPNLNPKLTEHLSKFTNRTSQSSYESLPVSTVKNLNQMKIGNEFSNIIKSYERLKKVNKNVNEAEIFNMNSLKKGIDKPVHNDTYVLGGHKSSFSKHITLNSLEDKITQKKIEGKTLTEDEVLLQRFTEEHKDVSTVKKSLDEIIPSDVYKSNTVKLSVVRKNEDISLLTYPEKITIPKNKFKQGCTYKLNDCYYDDDGLFLYRVPGMYK